MDKYLTSPIQVRGQDGDTNPMSRKLKALGALNLIGWTVAIPLLMLAMVGPLIAFHGWPSGLPGFHSDGEVRLGEPGERSGPARPYGRPGTGSPVLGPILPGGVVGVGGPGIAPGTPAGGGSGPTIGSLSRGRRRRVPRDSASLRESRPHARPRSGGAGSEHSAGARRVDAGLADPERPDHRRHRRASQRADLRRPRRSGLPRLGPQPSQR